MQIVVQVHTKSQSELSFFPVWHEFLAFFFFYIQTFFYIIMNLFTLLENLNKSRN
jgi:hypothetical protein